VAALGAGIFGGTSDLTGSIGKARPATLEDFINANRKYLTPS